LSLHPSKLSGTPRQQAIPFVLFVLLTGLGLSYIAYSQQVPGLDVKAQEQAITAHLNTVIQFYRALTQPIQKAGEPNDVVYRDQAVAEAAQIANLAFQSAKAEAAILAGSPTGSQPSSPGAPSATADQKQQKMRATEQDIETRISDLKAREAELDDQIPVAKPKALSALQVEKRQVQAALDLAYAMKDAMQKLLSMSATAGGSGLAADVDRLQRSVPELNSKNKTSFPQLTNIESATSAGVVSQAKVMFDLLSARHSLALLLQEDDHLHQQALDLRTPLVTILRSLVQQGQQLSDQAGQAPPPPAKTAGTQPPQPPAATPQAQLESIATRFKALAAASVPLSEEVILLEQSHANLAAWQTSVDREYDSILHALLLRILVIAIALAVIIGGGNIWTRATNKYVRDMRRRRQLLIVRRVVVGFLSVIVLLFGFVTQFNSLATFAGFITAGIAVGLQTILLSVAAYFFIIGRYGIKVGDRITIASVTGDVIDVGLVRFYLMELAGSGPQLNPTGRVAVFSNAVLFQAGTPLYKQVPGTGYAWHELTVKLADAADYQMVSDAVMKEIRAIYEEYRPSIERQHHTMQNWMQSSIDAPEIESRLLLTNGVFELWVRFPVQISHAAETDEKITHALLKLISSIPDIKQAITAPPSIQPSIRG
jgi:small-conductance mechanosensitive channel